LRGLEVEGFRGEGLRGLEVEGFRGEGLMLNLLQPLSTF
jgi:hypothetical protein